MWPVCALSNIKSGCHAKSITRAISTPIRASVSITARIVIKSKIDIADLNAVTLDGQIL